MQQYPKHIKRLIREYVSLAYEAELGQELGKLEHHFASWRSGQIGAGELSDLIHEFHQGPSRQIWSRYNYTRMDDMMIAAAILDRLLPRETIPAELLEALQPMLSSIERSRAMWKEIEGDQAEHPA